MKIEVLYVPECPSHTAAVQLVKDVLRAEGVVADIREVLVTDWHSAQRLDFRGSPTIRINGRDVAGPSSSPAGFALSCRIYPNSSRIGVPPVEVVRRAVLQAREGARPMKNGARR